MYVFVTVDIVLAPPFLMQHPRKSRLAKRTVSDAEDAALLREKVFIYVFVLLGSRSCLCASKRLLPRKCPSSFFVYDVVQGIGKI